MANCPTCGNKLPLTWEGCEPCVRGAHHCVDPECNCPVCYHPPLWKTSWSEPPAYKGKDEK